MEYTSCPTLYDAIKKVKNGNDDNDRLRKLPESVLGHILSLLPTKDAIGTSVLSTEWKYMWTLATNLHFDDRLLSSRRTNNRKAMFTNFVEKVLLQNGNSTIESFYLSCCEVYDEPCVNSWISTALRRNVKRLRIRLFQMEPGFVFPRCIHESKSLAELDLQMPCVLRVPSSMYFSSLKILSLCEVILQNGSSSLSNQLHLCFPLLEVFNLANCEWLNVEFVNIYAPALEIFTVSSLSWVKWTPARKPRMLDCVVNIEGSSITKFKFLCNSFTSQYNLRSPSSVVDAAIEVSTIANVWDQIHEFSLGTFSLLNQFLNVKSLILGKKTVMALACLEDLQDRLPTFDNLINLTFSRGWLAVDMTLMTFLHSSPALEALIFTGGISHFNQKEVVRGTVPQCLMSKLKVVKIRIFDRHEAFEIEAIKFFLKNAEVLEKMTLMGGTLGQDEKTKNELLALPKGSSCATLLFS